MPSKRKKRLAFVWSCLFLLQDFKMVFLLNIEEMRTSSTRIPDVSESSNGKERSSGRISNRLRKVLEALRSFGNRFKDRNASTVERVKAWLVDCESMDETAAYDFWRDNPTFSFVYILMSSVLYYIAECDLQMEQRAKEMVDLLGSKSTIQLVNALTEFDDAVSMLNDTENGMEESSSQEQEPDHVENLDPDVLSNLKSNVIDLLSINLFNTGEVNGIFNALARNFTIGNKTELENMLQQVNESSVNENLLNDSIMEDLPETEYRGLTSNMDAVQTTLKYDENELEFQKSLLGTNAVSSTLDHLKSQLSPLNFNSTKVQRGHTLNVSIETLKPDTINAYQNLLEVDYSTESLSIQMRRKRAADTVQHYIVYLSSNPCFVMTSSKEGNFSEFKRFDHLHEQKWRYDLKHLINFQTGLAVSVDTFSGHFENIMMLAEPNWDAESQSWNIDNENRLVHIGSMNCRLDIHNGYVSVYCGDSQPLIEIDLVPYWEYHRKHWQAACDSIDSFEFFFLKSSNSAHACKVLTVTDQKEHLTYQEVFDRDISWQLWRASNDHLVNMGSGLTLHLTKSGLELFDLNRTTMLNNSMKSSVWHDSLHMTLTQKDICQPLKASYEYDYDIDYKDKNADFEYNLYSNDDRENAENSTCHDTEEMNMTWTYITLESARNDLECISCFYIISNVNSSCELMIADGIQNHFLILATPEMEQMAQGEGLWYYSEKHLIHAGTGLALTSEIELAFSVFGLTRGVLQRRVGLDENQLWLLVDQKILTFDSKLHLTMQSQTTSMYTSEWLVSERRAVIENDIRKGCDDHRSLQDNNEDNTFYENIYDDKQTQRYFIRNKVSACKFLTGSGPGFPDFEYFATHKMENYIWTIKKSVIMHEDTQLVLSFINSESPHLTLIALEQQNASVSSQEWILNETRIMPKHYETCEMGLFEPNSDIIGLFCNESEIAYKEWELIHVSDHTEVKDLICPFFLRNDDKNCLFMTQLDRSDRVFAMPMYPQLMSLQLWYWDGSQIREVMSGKYLSVSNSDVVALVGSNVEANNSIKNWEFKQHHLSPYNDSGMHVVKQPDGAIRLRKWMDGETQKWSILFQKDLEHTDSVLYCENPDDRDVFLITSEKFPCVVLTSVRANERPIFVPFDENIMADQLWWLKEGTLINVGTRLYFGYNNSDHNTEVFMVQKDSSNQAISKVEFRSNSFLVQSGLDSFKLKTILNRDHTISLGKDYIGDTSTENNFDILKLSDIQENMDRIVCTFFIRNNLYPCQYLTGKGNMRRVMLEPLSNEMIEDQTWFWQGMKLIQAKTGLVLSKSESDSYLDLRPDSNTTWMKSASNKVQEGGLISGHMWEADPLSDGAIKLESSSYLPSQQWSFLRTEESLENPETLECPAKSSGMKQFYFVKNTQYPCILLTATDVGEYPKFKHLDTGSVEKQLWYEDNNNIINVGSGLALRALPNGKVDLWHRNAFKMDQKWFARDNTILSQNKEGPCLDFVKSLVPFQLHTCDEGILSQQWEWVPMENVDNMTCYYFIRNELQPCEFLTGFIGNRAVSVRPLVQDLMENQMWYWNATRLVHYKTGLELTVQNGNIGIQSSESASSAQSWEYQHKQNSIHLLNDSLNAVTMNPEENGLLYVTPYYQSRTQKWKFYEVVSSLENIDELLCPVEESAPTELFFIQNYDVPCHVLTARQKRQPPEFTHFSEDNISHQLWYMNGDSIVNSATFLALDIDHTTRSQVILNDRSAFVKSQKWVKDNQFIVSRENENCVLDAIRETPRIPISYCSKHGGHSQRWSFVPYDDSFSNFEKVICMTFIQNRRAPCELLTGFGINEEVRTRPVSQDLVSSQIWFWSGEKLINANTGLALDIENSNSGAKIRLRDKGDFITQNWVRDRFFIRSRANNYVVDLAVSHGDVITWANAHGEPNQQWYFVNKDEGLQNLDLLHCAAVINPQVYFLKSEEDPCPLLTHDGYDQITRRKLSNEPSKQLWFWIENQIVNVETGKALSLRNSSYDGAPVVLETRYAFELYQQWAGSNGQIQTLFKDQSKVLDFYNNALRIYHKDGTSTQKWTWLTTKDLNNDVKLLRCTHCYDRSEEKAAEIIGYIPIFSTIYNAIRAGVYAGKGCAEVALEALLSTLIDIAIDIVIVLSAGTASAAAYGIKVGLELGLKAGIKAVASAIKASIKVSVNAIKVSAKTVLKEGLMWSIKQQVKISILSVKSSLKSFLKALKNTPIAAKTVLTQSSKKLHFALRSVKAVSTSLKTNFKRLNILRKTQGFKAFTSSLTLSASKAGKSIRLSISKKMADIGRSIKSKLKEIGNTLAERAEKNIKLANTDVNDYKRLTRCKRRLGVCGLNSGRGNARIETITRSNDDVLYLSSDIDTSTFQANDVLLQDMSKMKTSTGISDSPGGQYAVVGLRNPATREIDDVSFMSVNDIRKIDPRPVPMGPEMNPVDPRGANVRPDADVQHAEQFLLEKKLNIEHLEKCSKSKDLCEIFLYTKYSPCISHGNSDAMSCMDYLTRKCTELSKQYNTKCIVGFDKWWGDSSPWLDDVEVKMVLSGDAVARENLKALGVSADTLDSIDTFLSKNTNQEKVRNIFQNMFKDTASGENRYNSIYKTEFAKKNYAFSDFERKELTTVWTDLNKPLDKVTDLGNFKKGIQESFNANFGDALKKIEIEAMEKFTRDVDNFLKANPNFDDKTLNFELFSNIEDKNLQKKLRDWSKKGRSQDMQDIKTELSRTIMEHFESIREIKADYSSKAFSIYLDDRFGEAVSQVLREELAIKKTMYNLQKVTTEKTVIEFIHLS